MTPIPSTSPGCVNRTFIETAPGCGVEVTQYGERVAVTIHAGGKCYTVTMDDKTASKLGVALDYADSAAWHIRVGREEAASIAEHAKIVAARESRRAKRSKS